jgi:hypothetical protein
MRMEEIIERVGVNDWDGRTSSDSMVLHPPDMPASFPRFYLRLGPPHVSSVLSPESPRHRLLAPFLRLPNLAS